MGFLDDLFGAGTEKKVSAVVDETMVKGKEFSEKVVEQGKLAAKAAQEKANEVKCMAEIETLKYSIGSEVVKKGLPIAKNDAKIKPMLDKIKKLEQKAKGSSTKTTKTTKAKAKKTAKKASKKTKKK